MTHIMSVGLGHEDAQEHIDGAHMVFDVRKMFKDPHGVSEEMRNMTGLDREVIENVLRQPGAQEYVFNIAYAVACLMDAGHDVFVVFACVGGRHRSVVLANELARVLWNEFYKHSFVTHAHIKYPIIGR